MTYLFYSSISENTASGNRFLGFLRAFDELKFTVTAVIHKSSSTRFHIPKVYKNVTIKELWKDWLIFGKIIDKLYAPISFRLFIRSLKQGDTVLVFGSPEYVHKFINIDGIKVFHERTEHPVVLPIRDDKLQKKYLQDCTKLDGLFVISTALKSYFVSIGVPEAIITIVNMTVDTERFKNLKRNVKKESLITYCGTASNNKDGVDQLIKAFAIVTEKHKDIKLQIIGNAPTADDASGNLQLVKELGIENRVIFTGMIPAARIPQMLTDSTILALDRPDSLQAQNGFPTKLGEYLLSERPVVVTKVGDISLFLTDGETALLSEERNPEDFASKLCWLLDHPATAEKIGKAGAKVAFSNFNYKTETKKIADAIFHTL